MLDFLRRWFGATEPGPTRPPDEEDPAVALGRSLEALERELAQAGESLQAVAAIRRDLEARGEQADRAIGHHTGHAERALILGREDLARQALAARWETEKRRDELGESLAEVDRQQAALELARGALQQKVEQLRLRRAEMGARLAAAKAQLHLREVMASVSEDVAAVNRAQERLEDRVEATWVQARSLAELAPGGTAVGGQQDPLERELSRLERGRRVELELQRIKREAMAARGDVEAGEGKGGPQEQWDSTAERGITEPEGRKGGEQR